MHTSTANIECRRFDRPDEVLDFHEHGRIDVVKLPDGTTGMRGIFEPGWRWEVDEKPLLGNPETCPLGHIGYCIDGEIVIRMVATGQEKTIRRGDFFEIPPGHDAYVPGVERCELILFAPADHT